MPKAVHHVALSCRDNAVTEAFYKKWFGFERARAFQDPKGNPVVFCRLGDFYLELFKSSDSAAEGGEQPVGFKHFCIHVDSVKDDYERMKDEVNFTVPPTQPPALPDVTLAFFQDPDGTIVQLLQGWK